MNFKNSETAEILGLSFGDGSFTLRKDTNKLRFQLRGNLNEDKEHYDSYIIPLFNKNIMNPIFGRNVGIVSNKNKGFYGISIQSEKLIVLSNLGMPVGRKIELKLNIPEWIRRNRKNCYAFLRGFLNTDGCVVCQRNYSIKNNKYHTQIRIYLSCCSKELMKEIYDFLIYCEFKCNFRIEQKRNSSTAYTIVVAGSLQVQKWFKLIGSKNPKHITKYFIWKRFGFCPPYTLLNARKKILKGEIDPKSYYAGVPEWPNGLERDNLGQPKELVA